MVPERCEVKKVQPALGLANKNTDFSVILHVCVSTLWKSPTQY